ncbi:MAG: TIM barrel protein [Verrucomicrobia bacterium]|nr:TIM barrel protein [Verrucomicrobiota bacterium]
MENSISRRSVIRKLAGTGAVIGTMTTNEFGESRAASVEKQLKGRINHSVCKWCYGGVDLEDLCREGRKMGLRSVELLETDSFPVLKRHDLVCAMVSGVPGGITKGLNRRENHASIREFFERTIPVVAEWGYPNIICFSGNRDGMSEEEGLEICAEGLRSVVGVAEKHKVTICMELLNSKVDHKDYMCDHTAWGAELARRVGSERFKLLYDIYHMQIMEGDVIRTIRENHRFIGHYHTGGVPGRHEIDEAQELYYPAIMRAIVETGFKGFVAQEFIPARKDVLESLRQGVSICDV